MKYAILGGSFDPVHIGHLFLADAVLSELKYDRVILVPAFQSPFKAGEVNASPQERIEMLAASICGDPGLTIDNCEIKREGISYTIDTLKDLISRYEPEGKPGLIIGDDLAATFSDWHCPEEIADLADIIIARRLSGDERTGFPYPHITLKNEIMNLASHSIREKIRLGGAWRYMVPHGARCIIQDKGLYGYSVPAKTTGANKSAESNFASGNFAESKVASDYKTTNPFSQEETLWETIARVENEVRSTLNFERFLHSRNTALLAWDLCGRFGMDRQKGYLAGIAHDICKTMSNDELMRLAHEDGGGISKLEKKKPGLLHARAAAIILSKNFKVSDRDILDAIRYHTTGKWNMDSLAKIVYSADKIEISRKGVDPAFRKMSESCDLETLFAAVLNNTVSYLKSRHVDVSYGTRRLMTAIQKEKKP